jgi:hypothetical protein
MSYLNRIGIIFLTLFVIACSTPTVASSNPKPQGKVLLKDDFSRPQRSQQWSHDEHGKGEPQQIGNVRGRLRAYVRRSETPWSGTGIKAAYRAERAFVIKGPENFMGKTYWFDYKFKFGQGINQSYPASLLFSQWHGRAGEGYWPGPDLGLKVQAGTFRIYSIPAKGLPNVKSWGTDLVTLPLEPYLNRWNHITVQRRLHPSDGMVKVWLNDKQLLDLEGIQTVDAKKDWFFFKLGAYVAPEVEMLFDDVTITQEVD